MVLLTLIMNGLTPHNPLDQGQDWVVALTLPMLWGETMRAAQFHDDALGQVGRSRGPWTDAAGDVRPSPAAVEQAGPAPAPFRHVRVSPLWGLPRCCGTDGPDPSFGIDEHDVMLKESLSLAITTQTSAYDAQYLVLAQRFSATLWTLDRRLGQVAKLHGIVVEPED